MLLKSIIDNVRAEANNRPPPAATPEGWLEPSADISTWAPALEKSLSAAVNRAVTTGGGQQSLLSRIADALEAGEVAPSAADAAPSAAEAALSAAEAGVWSAAYNRAFSMQRTLSKPNLTRSNSQILKQKSQVEYTEERRLAQINGYTINKALGKGAFGEVFLGTKDGASFAIKVLKRNKMKKTLRGPPGRPGGGPAIGPAGGASSSVLDSVKAEIATLKKISHPNLVVCMPNPGRAPAPCPLLPLLTHPTPSISLALALSLSLSPSLPLSLALSLSLSLSLAPSLSRVDRSSSMSSTNPRMIR